MWCHRLPPLDLLRAGIIGIIAGCTVIAPSFAAAADGFLSRLEDLPLVPGLSEDTTAGVSFDTAGGRIVEAFAHGDVTEGQVLDFYRETLPQLGWNAESATEYRRGGERLHIEVSKRERGLIVHFSLSPQ